METITVNGKVYYAEQPKETEIKIVVLQRGWVLIGRFYQEGTRCKLFDASVIRIWGTKKGLGELAKNGKQKDTILDKCFGVVEFDILTMVLSISVDESKWTREL